MLPILAFFNAGSAWLKVLVVLAVVGAIASAGGWAGYNLGVWKTTKEFTKIVDQIKIDRDQIKKDFEDYKKTQEERLRSLEVSSKELADQLEVQQNAFQKQVKTVKGSYEKKLAERKETPGLLSSSAVDSLNSIIDGFPPASVSDKEVVVK